MNQKPYVAPAITHSIQLDGAPLSYDPATTIICIGCGSHLEEGETFLRGRGADWCPRCAPLNLHPLLDERGF